MVTGDKTTRNLILKDADLSISSFASISGLSIQVFEDKVLVTCFDLDKETYIGFEEIYFTSIQEVFQQSEFLNYTNYKSITASFFSSKETIIPNAIFEPNRRNEFFKFNFGELQEVKYQPLENIESHILFQVNNHELLDELHLRFPTMDLLSFGAVFIESSVEGFNFYFVGKHYFICTLKENNKLQYFNIFEYQTEEDALYYILSIVQGNKVKLEEAIFNFSGDITLTGDLFQLICNYVSKEQINFMTIFKNKRFAPSLYQLSRHQYYTLFNQ